MLLSKDTNGKISKIKNHQIASVFGRRSGKAQTFTPEMGPKEVAKIIAEKLMNSIEKKS